MYGAIGHSIWNKEYWGEQSDDFQSNLFYDDTLKDLEKVAREHQPILQTIQNRERDAQDLSSHYSLTEDDDPDSTFGYSYTLENQLKQECQENGEDTEWANRLRAAIGWRENSDEIKKLKEELQEARNAMYHARKGASDEERKTYTQNRQKSFEAENSLKFTKQHAIEKYTEQSWHKDYYDFTSDFETFLSDIAFHRRFFRSNLDWGNTEINELIQKYLENPLWHVPQITDFLLTDLIDSDLLRLERDFQFGLFSSKISNELWGPNNYFASDLGLDIGQASPSLNPESKERRSKWRFRRVLIGGILILSPLIYREALDKLEISMGFPSWISFPEILQAIGFIFFIGPLFYSIVGEAINKRRIDIKSLYRKAHTLLNIRWDISSGIYDAKTCIERLKRIDQPLHISSLVYPLLELQKRLQTLP